MKDNPITPEAIEAARAAVLELLRKRYGRHFVYLEPGERPGPGAVRINLTPPAREERSDV